MRSPTPQLAPHGGEGVALDFPHALAGQAQNLADLFQRPARRTEPEHAALPAGLRSSNACPRRVGASSESGCPSVLQPGSVTMNAAERTALIRTLAQHHWAGRPECFLAACPVSAAYPPLCS